MDILKENVLKRKRLVLIYKNLLSQLPGISFQKIEVKSRSSFKDFSILPISGRVSVK